MKTLKTFLASGLLLAAVTVRADNIKLNFVQQTGVLQALQGLDGTARLDKENTKVVVGFDFAGSTRIAIMKDITALQAGLQTVREAEAHYMKGHGIAEVKSATPEQLAAMDEIANTPSDVTLIKFSTDDLRLDSNAIPGSVLAALAPLIK
ncbi:MAG TPA: hypothetical protein VGG34_01500 [Opitutaceae bacterium]|jgi:hypothetical protein